MSHMDENKTPEETTPMLQTAFVLRPLHEKSPISHTDTTFLSTFK